jgi:hypothetical protein
MANGATGMRRLLDRMNEFRRQRQPLPFPASRFGAPKPEPTHHDPHNEGDTQIPPDQQPGGGPPHR